MRRFPKSRDLNWRSAYTTGDGDLAPPSAPDSDGAFHAPGTDKFLFSGVPHPTSPDAQRMTAHELGLWDRLEREACLLEAYALTPLYLTEYLRAETGYEVAGLSGLLPGLIQGLKVLAATTVAGAAAGAAAGTPFFGVGAVPGAIFGAEAGLDAGLYLLFLAGLPALAEYVAANIGRVVALFQQGTGIAWNAPDSPLVQAEVERAARCFAQGVAIWVRIVLEAVVLYLIGKGAAGAARRLAREMHAAGYGALAETVEAEGTSLVGNPKLQPKLAGPGESGGGGEPTSPPKTSEAKPSKPAQETASKPVTKTFAEGEIPAAERQQVATEWYSQHNPKTAVSRANGFDVTQPMRIRTLQPGEEIAQWVRNDGKPGIDFTTPGRDPATLGVELDPATALPANRTLQIFKVVKPTQVLEGTAADFPSGIIESVGGKGGGTQIAMPPNWQQGLTRVN
jgi:hypothetical protein